MYLIDESEKKNNNWLYIGLLVSLVFHALIFFALPSWEASPALSIFPVQGFGYIEIGHDTEPSPREEVQATDPQLAAQQADTSEAKSEAMPEPKTEPAVKAQSKPEPKPETKPEPKSEPKPVQQPAPQKPSQPKVAENSVKPADPAPPLTSKTGKEAIPTLDKAAKSLGDLQQGNDDAADSEPASEGSAASERQEQAQRVDSKTDGRGTGDPAVGNDSDKPASSSQRRVGIAGGGLISTPKNVRNAGTESRVKIEIFFDASGRISRAVLKESSGNPNIDNSALQHAQRILRLVVPVAPEGGGSLTFKTDVTYIFKPGQNSEVQINEEYTVVE